MKSSSPGWTEFNTGSTTVALHTTVVGEQSVQAGRPPAGRAHLGFVVEDLQATYEALKAHGVSFSMPPQKQPSGVTLAVLRDPDGLGISLQQR